MERRADNVEIIISDEGPGIPDSAREQVFTPFFRMENSRNRETGGVGLGLSIARTIVRHHGGDIALTNGPKGLHAIISLPAQEGAPPPVSQPITTAAAKDVINDLEPAPRGISA